jgi:glucuronate isomerase
VRAQLLHALGICGKMKKKAGGGTMSHQTSALGIGSAHAEALYAYRVAAPVRCTREQIAVLRANRPYQNVAELLLGDPRRRALLRTVGVAEDFVFGDGADLEVLRAFCAAMEGAPDNLAHAQVRLELEKVLGITLPLCADTADEIWAQSAARFSATDVTPRALLSHSAASALLVFCAPEDGLDGLSAEGVRVLPLFCPEGLLDPADPSFLHTVSALSAAGAPSVPSICATIASKSVSAFCIRIFKTVR